MLIKLMLLIQRIGKRILLWKRFFSNFENRTIIFIYPWIGDP